MLFPHPYELPLEFAFTNANNFVMVWAQKRIFILGGNVYIAFLLSLQRKKGKSYVLDDNFMMCKFGDGAMCELREWCNGVASQEMVDNLNKSGCVRVRGRKVAWFRVWGGSIGR
jgi:hypothetical protein